LLHAGHSRRFVFSEPATATDKKYILTKNYFASHPAL